MIIQPTLEQTRRILRKRTYSGPGFGPRSFECLGMGLGLGLTFASGPSAPAPINLLSKFSGALVHVQSDLGVTYGTPRASTGNTSTTALTQSGTAPSVVVPIRAKATNTASIGSGAQFSIYYDGGTTPAMTGVTPTAGAPVALTGAGSNAMLTWSAGASVANDTWDATASSLFDWSAGATPFSKVAAAGQPVFTVGVNGCAGLSLDGVIQELNSSCAVPAPGTTPYKYYLVGRIPATNSATAFLVSGTGGSVGCLYMPTGGAMTLQQYNGFTANANNTAVANTWYAFQASFGNSIADSITVGALTPTTGASSGNLQVGGRNIGSAGGSSFAKFELLSFTIYTGTATGIAAAVAAKYAGLVAA